jgi:hypothetical protein
MSYLGFLAEEFGTGTRNQTPVAQLVRWSLVQEMLRDLGYRTVAFSTGYRRSEIETADIYLRAPSSHVTPFESTLLETSVFIAVADGARGLGLPVRYPGYAWQREQITFTLEQLSEVAALPGPKFVFAHIVAPHPPFVFGVGGEALSPPYPYRLRDGDEFPGTGEEYVAGYVAQVTFINTQIQEVLGEILATSERPPVIILQADHGPGLRTNWEFPEETDLEERLSILNAYYLPGADVSLLYETISPVNTFRVILNTYFGAGLELLPDQSFFSSWTAPFRFIPAP